MCGKCNLQDVINSMTVFKYYKKNKQKINKTDKPLGRLTKKKEREGSNKQNQ